MSKSDWTNEIEPAANSGGWMDVGQKAQVSQAISLKRIADFLCGSDQRCDIVGYVRNEFRRS